VTVPRIALVLALTVAGCGYHLASGYHARDGSEHVHVAAFENRSAEPELGAVVTAALRGELSRRGASGGEGAPAVIEGEVRALPGVPSSTGGATWRAGLEVHARLVVEGRAVTERTIRREANHLGGADALETEGRRAIALRRLADDVARELVRAFEMP
jgi:hypothetical protein